MKRILATFFVAVGFLVNTSLPGSAVDGVPSGFYLLPLNGGVGVGKQLQLLVVDVPRIGMPVTDLLPPTIRRRTQPEIQVTSWSSSDPSIATVDSNGQVTGISKGMVTISAIALRAGTEPTPIHNRVTVGEPVATVWARRNDAVSIPVDCSRDVQVQLVDSHGQNLHNRPVRWESAAPDIASVEPLSLSSSTRAELAILEFLARYRERPVAVAAVDEVFFHKNATINGRNVGQTVLTATSEDATLELNIDVAPSNPASIQIFPAGLELHVQQTKRPNVEVINEHDCEVPSAQVTWQVADTSIAAVDSQTGDVRGVRVGTTTLTAMTQNGVSTSINIRVLPSVINPNMNYGHSYKGQLHIHTDFSDGNQPLRRVVRIYRYCGYDFVSITDHGTAHSPSASCNEVFTKSGLDHIIEIPGSEAGGRAHLIQVGLERQDECLPSGDYEVSKSVRWVDDQGGLAFAAHPNYLQGGHQWTAEELYEIPWMRGLEIKSPRRIEIWDMLLSADRPRWGFGTDDSHTMNDFNRRWVVVNSAADRPTRHDILDQLREGNFYSVSLMNTALKNIDCTVDVPQFDQISYDLDFIIVRFRGAKTVRFIGAIGELDVREFGEDQGDWREVALKIDGTEGYVRVEIEDSRGAVAYSQPLFVYGQSEEDCVPLDYQSAEVKNIDSDWKIAIDSNWLMSFDSEQDAESALSIIKHYQIEKICYITRPYAKMLYYLTENGAPAGPMVGEDCISFDRLNLRASLIEEDSPIPYHMIRSWQVLDGDRPIVDFADSQIQARRALEIIDRYEFSRQCFSEGRGMMYFLK